MINNKELQEHIVLLIKEDKVQNQINNNNKIIKNNKINNKI